MQGIGLCTKCVGVRVDSLLSACLASGTWHKLVHETYVTQIIDALDKHDQCIVDRATNSVCHVLAHKLLVASQQLHASIADWSLQEREFAAKHCGKNKMWYHPRQKMLRRITPLRLYDKPSILAHMKRNSIQGISLTDIVKEYEDAHLHVYSLLQEKKLLLHAGTLWLARSSDT